MSVRAAVAMALTAVVLAGVASGCGGPRLASRPLSEEQSEWASIIRTSYPGWQPPYYTTVVPRAPALVPVVPLGLGAGPTATGQPPAAAGAAPAGDVEFVPAAPAP
jgi:hypothetical protein